MPRRGQFKARYRPGRSREEHALTSAIRAACRRAQRGDLKTQGAIASKLGFTEPTLSAWVGGKKHPTPQALSDLWKLAPGRSGMKWRGARPRNSSELLALWAQAEAARKLRRCTERTQRLRMTRRDGKRPSGLAAPGPHQKPAVLNVRRSTSSRLLRRRDLTQQAKTAVYIAATAADTKLPVPRVPGDRQHDTPRTSAWTGLEALIASFATDETGQSAMPVLNHVALNYEIDDMINVVIACRDEEVLHPAADTLLRSAGRQRRLEDVIAITDALHRSNRPADAALVISSASRRTAAI